MLLPFGLFTNSQELQMYSVKIINKKWIGKDMKESNPTLI